MKQPAHGIRDPREPPESGAAPEQSPPGPSPQSTSTRLPPTTTSKLGWLLSANGTLHSFWVPVVSVPFGLTTVQAQDE
jgi:hypothetical protein